MRTASRNGSCSLKRIDPIRRAGVKARSPLKVTVTPTRNLLESNQMNADQYKWEIGLSSWIIQDGNYPDFTTGQHAEFALEFYSQTYQKSDMRSKSSKNLGAAKYEIIGEVVYLTPELWVLDFGICAFQESKPAEGISVGSFVAAEIYLSIDPFFYFERLYTLPKMPALIYSWKINSVGQQTAPFVETREPSGQKVLIRDENKLGYRAIAKTDAWKDDGGNAEYVLTCTRLDVQPKFESATAT
jgi:hypothetical protein